MEYDKIIREQLQAGIIETIEPELVQEAAKACSWFGGPLLSLNDCLETGLNCIPKLFNILVQFRWHRVAVTADIEKAFLVVLPIVHFCGVRIHSSSHMS